jgi:competence protein ComEC
MRRLAKGCIAAGSLLASWTVHALAVEQLESRFEAGRYFISLEAVLDAAPSAVGVVLKDYEAYPALDTSIRSSERIGVEPDGAVLLRTRSHLLVYDSGPAYTPQADAGSRVLLPLLRVRGETRIHLLMLSHRDSDHVGGAAALLAGVPVAAVSRSLDDGHPLRETLAARGVPHRPCVAGQRWRWDGVAFEVLHPAQADLGLPHKPNALSCVLRVQAAGGASVLLTGDIEAAQEAALLQRDAAVLRADVLLVPHHGSKTSSTAAFLDAVQPGVAVVQAGYRSRFGHPAPPVLARYAERGIVVMRSDRCGAWTWPANAVAGPASAQTPGAGLCARDVARRYWHHRPPESVATVR